MVRTLSFSLYSADMTTQAYFGCFSLLVSLVAHVNSHEILRLLKLLDSQLPTAGKRYRHPSPGFHLVDVLYPPEMQRDRKSVV